MPNYDATTTCDNDPFWLHNCNNLFSLLNSVQTQEFLLKINEVCWLPTVTYTLRKL